MDDIRHVEINYTEDFRVACKINNLGCRELLQYFIDHVSFYAFIGGDMEAGYIWSTMVITECKELFGRAVNSVKDQDIQQISLKNIRKLTALNQEPGLSVKAQSSKSCSLMKEWAIEMLPLVNYPERLAINDAEELKLTFDFNMLCGMTGLMVEHVLQYFIDSVSLARHRAVNLFKTVKTDSGTYVLLYLVSEHEAIKNRVLPHQEVYKKYGLRLLKLDKKQREENNIENRIHNYNAFYLDWYNALSKE